MADREPPDLAAGFGTVRGTVGPSHPDQQRPPESLMLRHRTVRPHKGNQTQTYAQTRQSQRHENCGGQILEIQSQTMAVNDVTICDASNFRTLAESSNTNTRQNWVTFEEETSPRLQRSNIRSSAHSARTNNTTPDDGSRRHVSFCYGADKQSESSSELSSSQPCMRSVTGASVAYHNYSEGEECRESEVSVNLSSDSPRCSRRRTNSLSALLSSCTRRQEKRATAVTDSFVNECICCCTIL